MLVKALLSPAFKNAKKGHTEEQIDVDWLKLFSICHCAGKPIDKADALFCVLQEGGFERHEWIAAGDKDFEPVFQKLSEFATRDVFKNAADAGFAQKDVYTQDEVSQLLGDAMETVRENFLDEVYDVSAKLLAKEWCKLTAKKSTWIFNSSQLRTKLFAEAGIAKRHLTE